MSKTKPDGRWATLDQITRIDWANLRAHIADCPHCQGTGFDDEAPEPPEDDPHYQHDPTVTMA